MKSAGSKFDLSLRTGVTAAVFSEIRTVAEIKDTFKCGIGAEMTEVQCFRRNVGAGSN